nr:hypothetical protein [Tanacetum cinerariifolium]
MRPKFLGLGYKNYNKTANVTTLQETSDENKALSQLSKKRKTELTIKESRLANLDMQIRECELNNEREKVVSLRKEKERLVMEVISSALVVKYFRFLNNYHREEGIGGSPKAGFRASLLGLAFFVLRLSNVSTSH